MEPHGLRLKMGLLAGLRTLKAVKPTLQAQTCGKNLRGCKECPWLQFQVGHCYHVESNPEHTEGNSCRQQGGRAQLCTWRMQLNINRSRHIPVSKRSTGKGREASVSTAISMKQCLPTSACKETAMLSE